MSHTLLYILNALAPIVTFFFIARFLLQATQADFYNPISQGVVAVTNPILKPIRMLVPSVGRWDFAALIGAALVEGLFAYIFILLAGEFFPGFAPLIIHALFEALSMLLTVIWAMILINIVASLLAAFGGMNLQHPILSLISQIIEPIMAPARRLIPPMGGLDFSPILVILLIDVVNHSILPQLKNGILGAL